MTTLRVRSVPSVQAAGRDVKAVRAALAASNFHKEALNAQREAHHAFSALQQAQNDLQNGHTRRRVSSCACGRCVVRTGVLLIDSATVACRGCPRLPVRSCECTTVCTPERLSPSSVPT